MEILILLGSGEFTDSMLEVDKYLLTEYTVNNVTILPTAAGKERSVYSWIEKAQDHYAKLNTSINGLKVYKKEDAENKEYIDQINLSNFIYFSGGDPGYLRDVLFNSPLWTNIYNKYLNGCLIAGSSAGAMVMGKYVLSNPQSMVIGKSKWEEALGLIDYLVIPHFNMITRFRGINRIKEIAKNLPSYINNKFLGIDEDTALILLDRTHAKVMGKGNVYTFINNEEVIYTNNETFEMK